MNGKEALEEHFADLTSNYPEDYVESYNAVLNAIKTLEIIKEKGVCLPALKLTASFEEDNLEEYNKICLKHYALPLTQEEYDLLKEILL